jgi:hypothetical protein
MIFVSVLGKHSGMIFVYSLPVSLSLPLPNAKEPMYLGKQR